MFFRFRKVLFTSRLAKLKRIMLLYDDDHMIFGTDDHEVKFLFQMELSINIIKKSIINYTKIYSNGTTFLKRVELVVEATMNINKNNQISNYREKTNFKLQSITCVKIINNECYFNLFRFFTFFFFKFVKEKFKSQLVRQSVK